MKTQHMRSIATETLFRFLEQGDRYHVGYGVSLSKINSETGWMIYYRGKHADAYRPNCDHDNEKHMRSIGVVPGSENWRAGLVMLGARECGDDPQRVQKWAGIPVVQKLMRISLDMPTVNRTLRRGRLAHQPLTKLIQTVVMTRSASRKLAAVFS